MHRSIAIVTGSLGLLAAMLVPRPCAASFTDIGAGLEAVSGSAVAWGDYDNDGDLDVLLTGTTGTVAVTHLYRNDGAGVFTDVATAMPGVEYGAVAWGDYDGDDDLDVLLIGGASSGRITRVYRNDSGVFTDIGAGLPGTAGSAVAWVDYDNDGDLDIFLSGYSDGGYIVRIYRNNDDETFSDIDAGLQGVSGSAVAWGDYDNDGDQDLLLSGFYGSTYYTRLYRNDGDETFTTVVTGLPDVYWGSAAWGDYDNDGDLDILLTGATTESPPQPIGYVYRNDGGTFVMARVLVDVWYSSGSWGDYDNDGDLDILIMGYRGEGPNYAPVARVYRNNGGGSFTDLSAGLPLIGNRSAVWGDYDNDGDLDILLAGTTGAAPMSRIYRNDGVPANTPPQPPANLSTQVTNGRVTLSWSASTDGQTPSSGLSYNVRIGTSPGGSDVVPAMANSENGYRRVVQLGNGQERTSWTVTLRVAGTYYWSVQAVDGAFAGSSFAPERNFSATVPFTDIAAGLPGVVLGSVAWGDYDDDGDLDILLTGQTVGPMISRIYRSDGNGVFTGISAGLPGVYESAVAWGDYDGDGDLDILLTGDASGALSCISRVYRNDGGGAFTDIAAGLYGVDRGSVAWGDYDNDGDLDILLTGVGSNLVSRVYRNDGGVFTDIVAGLPGVYQSSVAWGDCDRDGDLDILLAGSIYGGTRVTRIYRNDGELGFTDIAVGLPSISDGSVAWGDYNNDGYLDILLTGYTGTEVISRVYRSEAGGTIFTDISAGLPGVRDGAAVWGDYDNDGDLDILATGNMGSTRVSRVYRNDGGTAFSDITAGLPGVSYSSAAWGDYDNDGDLDILLAGFWTERISRVYRNETALANSPPTAPGSLSALPIGTEVTLSWTESTDAQTPQAGLSYNLRIGTTPGGNEICPGMADAGTGYRRVVRLGNAQERTSWTASVPGSGTYYWSAQALDGAFAGSPFAVERSFSVGPPSSGTATVGPTGDYASLTQAFADISAWGLPGPMVLELQAAYVSTVETFPLTAGAFPGSSGENTVTIRPAAGATGLSITSANTTGTLDLNGATYVIFDGRPGGTGTQSQLAIANTNTAGWAVRFVNDAGFNTLQNLVVRGVTTSSSNGVVLFNTTTGANGNDDNTIDHCNIRDGATTPTILVYSSGTTTTTAQNNSGNVISNCNVFNFFNSTATHAGISLAAGNQDWMIDGNSFYETGARFMSGTGTLEWQAVASSSSSTNGLQILDNYIGGSAPECGGGPLTYTGNATLRALRLTVGTATPTSIQGNTFRNIAVNSTSASSSQTMIGLVSGSFNVGTETPNLIGRQDAGGSITFALSNTSTAAFAGISAGTGTPGTIVISNNQIGGISISQVGGAGTATARGISLATTNGSGTYTVTGNTIGSPDVANSFTSANGATTGIGSVTVSGFTAIAANVAGNTIANLSYSGTSSNTRQLLGIYIGGIGDWSITDNTVRGLSSTSTATGSGSSASVVGITANAFSSSNRSVLRNQVYALSNTASTAATCVTGISLTGSSLGSTIVARNLVHSLTLSTSGVSSNAFVNQISGIDVNMTQHGAVNCLNNMVRLGLDAAGNAITTGYPIVGIYEYGARANTFLGNSVCVGGAGVVAVRETCALRSDGAEDERTYKDNILVNARSNASGTAKNYAVQYQTIDVGNNSDYNDLFTPGTGGCVGGTVVGGLPVGYPTLADWQVGTGRDANSISTDPLFVNAGGGTATVDLHIDTTVFPPSPVANVGVTLATLTDDYDGEVRGSSPDIGADEFMNFMISASAGPDGTIDPAGFLLVNAGTDLTFAMDPDSGYAVADVMVDTVSVGPVPSYTFYDIQRNHDIWVTFGLQTFTITATAGPGGTITPSGEVEVSYGGSQQFDIAALPGYAIQQVTVDGSSQGPIPTYTFSGVTTDHTIHATFVDIAAPQVAVTAPNGAEVWTVGSSQAITWTATDNVGVTAIDLAYSTDGGASYPFVIGTGLPNTGSHPWTVPDTPSTTCRVRVSARDAVGNTAADASDANFEIRGEQSAVPEVLLGEHEVLGVYPNPAGSAGAHVLFRLTQPGAFAVGIYDIGGRLVRQLGSGSAAIGVRAVAWDGRDGSGSALPGGIYMVRFTSGSGAHATKRFVLVR